MSPIDSLLARWELDPELPAACEAEARSLDEGVEDPALDELRELPFCTIDEPTSKDLDQAVHVQAEGDRWRLRYAIADASWFVRPGTALFTEALRRGASCYLPGLVVPMLPRRLSEGIVSLNPGVDRRALVFDLLVARDGSVLSRRIHRARIHSQAKLSYDGVQAWLDGGAVPTDRVAVLESLEAMVGLGRARLLDAEARDAISIRRAEVEVQRAGLRFVALTDSRNDVQLYNEQISLLCNMVGADLLASAPGPDMQAVFRVHSPPSRSRSAQLRAFVAELARLHGDGDLVWAKRQSLSTYLRGVPDDGPGAAIHRAATRSGGNSGYSSEPGRHHGVGADAYARFTAPMREVIGVFTHKEAWEHLLGTPGTPDDEAIRERVISAALAARQRQAQIDKEVNRLVLDPLLASAQEHAATLLDLTSTRALVRLDDPAVELKAYLRDLPGARAEGLQLLSDAGTMRVGDRVRVRALDVDPRHDRWRLSLVPGSPDAGPRPPSP